MTVIYWLGEFNVKASWKATEGEARGVSFWCPANIFYAIARRMTKIRKSKYAYSML